MPMTKRRRRVVGFLPRLGRGILAAGQWLVRHPQPFFMLAAFMASCSALWAYAQRSEAFRITRIALPPQSTLHLPESLMGENVWRVDLEAMATRLEAQQPSLKEVRVVRELPNALRIEEIARSPIAQVRVAAAGQAGWHSIDGDGFIFPEASQAPHPRWIRLTGIDFAKGQLFIGKPNTQESLKLGLRVLDTLRHAPESLRRRITELNIADPQQLRFLIDLGSCDGWPCVEMSLDVARTSACATSPAKHSGGQP